MQQSMNALQEQLHECDKTIQNQRQEIAKLQEALRQALKLAHEAISRSSSSFSFWLASLICLFMSLSRCARHPKQYDFFRSHKPFFFT
jgi:hypothetical protein